MAYEHVFKRGVYESFVLWVQRSSAARRIVTEYCEANREKDEVVTAVAVTSGATRARSADKDDGGARRRGGRRCSVCNLNFAPVFKYASMTFHLSSQQRQGNQLSVQAGKRCC
eukprot:2045145-Amphidinium_carterae.1